MHPEHVLSHMQQEFASFLAHSLDTVEDSTIKEAMCYSLLAGGKRLRPMLLFAYLADQKEDVSLAMPIGAAIEMIHTYSLIHDDLPAMDNDVLRRGKPTCHIKFDEATAILAGDALLTQAFTIVMSSAYSWETKGRIIAELADASGANGMILGQHYDMKAEIQDSHTAHTIEQIDRLKTGKLIALPLRLAAIIAKQDDLLDELTVVATTLGIAFQIQDDVLNVTSEVSRMGKSVHSDAASNKATYVSLLGLEGAQKKVAQLFSEVYTWVNSKTSFAVMKQLIDVFYHRNH